MNRLEAEARPIVTTLAKADPPTIVTGSQLHTLAKWISLKCMVVEHDKPSLAVTPQTERTAFMTDGTIPDFFKIYAMLNVSGHGIGFIRHTHCVALSEEGPSPPVDAATPQNIQTISFLVGRAFFHLNAARIENFDLEKSANIIPVWDRSRIWPPQHTPWQWPRRPALNTSGVRGVAEILDRFLSVGKRTWKESLF